MSKETKPDGEEPPYEPEPGGCVWLILMTIGPMGTAHAVMENSEVKAEVRRTRGGSVNPEVPFDTRYILASALPDTLRVYMIYQSISSGPNHQDQSTLAPIIVVHLILGVCQALYALNRVNTFREANLKS